MPKYHIKNVVMKNFTSLYLYVSVDSRYITLVFVHVSLRFIVIVTIEIVDLTIDLYHIFFYTQHIET